MKRIPEPELMCDKRQANAYARADFEAPHSNFIDLLKLSMRNDFGESALAIDLGTGAADIAIRFALEFPLFEVDAVDGSNEMLFEAEKAIAKNGLKNKINLINSPIQKISLAKKEYAVIFSNSLLHHLQDPLVLWKLLKHVKGNPLIFIMDLIRPKTLKQVEKMTKQYTANEPDILKRDFKNSLKAAFTIEEVDLQLTSVGLEDLCVKAVSDRHMIIYNR